MSSGDKASRQELPTPRTDALQAASIEQAGRGEGDPATDYIALQDLARQLERELAEVRQERNTLQKICAERADALEAAGLPADGAPRPSLAPQGKLWLWKNFVDGRPEYWAFDNPYPCKPGPGDPLVLGEPCGYALFKESTAANTNVPEAEVIAAIKRARPAPPSPLAATEVPEGCTVADAQMLRKANGDLAQESCLLRIVLSELVEAVDGCNDMDEADGEEYWTAANRLDAVMEKATPYTEDALLAKAQGELAVSPTRRNCPACYDREACLWPSKCAVSATERKLP